MRENTLKYEDIDEDKAFLGEVFENENENDSIPVTDILGTYLIDIAKFEFLTAEEEKDLLNKATKGDQLAVQRVLESHLKLCTKLARRYRSYEHEVLDLISEGNLGILHAIQKFNPEVGARFSTYASWWIQEYMQVYLMKNTRCVRIPIELTKNLKRCYKACQDLNIDIDKQPSFKKIAEHLGCDVKNVETWMQHKDGGCSIELFLDNYESNLNTNAGGYFQQNGFFNLEETVIDELVKKNQQKELMDMISTLNPFKHDVLIRRYGLKGYDKMTLQSIGDEFDLTKERIRQLEQQGLQELKKISNKRLGRV